ncbi:hypothetical protein ACFSLT_31475 [Novosphingobium resinovorum]
MNRPPMPLSAIAWTPDLVSALADASSAIGRLDARISATALAPAWHLRASWTGYAKALSLQHLEIEEIDIISRQCGLQLAGRPRLETAGAPFSALEPWRNRLAEKEGRHWREDLPFSFDLPAGWDEAPALARALALLDDWARRDRTITPWLAFPMVLRRMGLTQRTLPCLVMGDPGQRFVQGDRPALLKRLLKQLRRSAEDGLTRLERLEDTVQRGAATIAAQHRPGKLADLGRSPSPVPAWPLAHSLPSSTSPCRAQASYSSVRPASACWSKYPGAEPGAPMSPPTSPSRSAWSLRCGDAPSSACPLTNAGFGPCSV